MSATSLLDKLARLEVVTWEWNELAERAGCVPGTRSIGVVSQQVARVFPELVVERDGLLVVDYAGLTAIVLQGLQELTKRLEQLERRP